MADTKRTLAALQALLADNATGDIDPADIRDFLISVHPESADGAMPPLASAPISPFTGQGYYDTILNQIGIYSGGSWHYFG